MTPAGCSLVVMYSCGVARSTRPTSTGTSWPGRVARATGPRARFRLRRAAGTYSTPSPRPSTTGTGLRSRPTTEIPSKAGTNSRTELTGLGGCSSSPTGARTSNGPRILRNLVVTSLRRLLHRLCPVGEPPRPSRGQDPSGSVLADQPPVLHRVLHVLLHVW